MIPASAFAGALGDIISTSSPCCSISTYISRAGNRITSILILIFVSAACLFAVLVVILDHFVLHEDARSL